MLLNFPNDFFWGVTTTATQIETPSEHSWKGTRSLDGHTFDRTADHEKHRLEDIEHIARFGTVYRCSVDWARLQLEPFGKFDHQVVEEYQQFFKKLNERGIKIMFMLHHFTNPVWFEKKGGWLYEENASYFSDFVKKCINNFGRQVSYWITFNEPNLYAVNAFWLGKYPPRRKSHRNANEVLQNMGIAHQAVYTMLKVYDKKIPVGVSLNVTAFKGANLLGKFPAWYMNWWYNKRAATHFDKIDFWGLNYFGQMLFNPRPVTEIHQAGKLDKLNIPHDKILAYYPEGLLKFLRRFHKKYEKHIIITENGTCTSDNDFRIKSIKEHLEMVQDAIKEGIYVEGYIHKTLFDGFEWDLGPTFTYGLMRTNWTTKEREDSSAARFYEKVAKNNSVDI